jgi:hypothetical protein
VAVAVVKQQMVTLADQVVVLRVTAIVAVLQLQVKEMLVVTEQVFRQAFPLVVVAALELLVIMAFQVKVVTEALALLGMTA